MERSTIFKFGKPSISMDHLYHGYVSHNQRVITDDDVAYFMGKFHDWGISGNMCFCFTLWLFHRAMENCPFIDRLPIKNCDFPWLWYILFLGVSLSKSKKRQVNTYQLQIGAIS